MATDGIDLPPGEHDPRLVVRRPRPGLSGGAIAILIGVLAVLLFVILENRRHQTVRQLPPALDNAFPPAPTLVVPPEAPPVPLAPPVSTIVTTAAPRPFFTPTPIPRPYTAPFVPAPSAIQAPPTAPERATSAPTREEPALVLDTAAGEAVVPGGTTTTTRSGTGSGTSGSTGTTGNAGSSDDAPIRATVIHNRSTVMPAGTIIPITLETPIDTARPGLVRALVAEDARGFDGKQVLVPRGSRLIGEYEADVRSSQNRVLVNWTRLIRPDGVAIRIGSPAADALGGAGVPGHLNTFFFRRFAGAVLQSALTVGVNLASRPGNGSVIVGLPSSGVGTIGQDLVPGNDLKPKITVKQGAVLNVFVAHDLDFTGTPYKPAPEPK